MNAAANPSGTASTTHQLESGVPPVPPEGSPKAAVEGAGSGAVRAGLIRKREVQDVVVDERRCFLVRAVGEELAPQFLLSIGCFAQRLSEGSARGTGSVCKMLSGSLFMLRDTIGELVVDGCVGEKELSPDAFDLVVSLNAVRPICRVSRKERYAAGTPGSRLRAGARRATRRSATAQRLRESTC